MINKNNKLAKQLMFLIVIVFAIVFLVIGVIVPKFSAPVYDEAIYHHLEQSLQIAPSDMGDSKILSEIAYIYIIDEKIVHSANIEDVLDSKKLPNILKKIDSDYGKFTYEENTYYYHTIKDSKTIKVALTNDRFINQTKKEIFLKTIPIILLTYSLLTIIIFIWTNKLVKSIELLKEKVDHIDESDYDHSLKIKDDNELKSLECTIEDMRLSLKNQEELRNSMYQNISHDFKTPLTVIRSYIEAVNDGVETKEKAFKVILDQTNTLSKKVKSLLYLNKLDYLKDHSPIYSKIKIKKVIDESVEKFKYERKDVKFIINVDENAEVFGTIDIWETVIDNILNNFLRHTDKIIKITVKGNQINLYNDGPKINPELLESIFIPFRKGVKGEFGLGLSIVKKTLKMISYDISVRNHSKKGVTFTINKIKD